MKNTSVFFFIIFFLLGTFLPYAAYQCAAQELTSTQLFENESEMAPIWNSTGFVSLNSDGSWFTTSYPSQIVEVNGEITETTSNNLLVLYHYSDNGTLLDYFIFSSNNSFIVSDAQLSKSGNYLIRLSALSSTSNLEIKLIESVSGNTVSSFEANDLIVELSDNREILNTIASNYRNGLIGQLRKNKFFIDEEDNLYFAIGHIKKSQSGSNNYLSINDSIFDFNLDDWVVFGSVIQLDSNRNLVNRVHLGSQVDIQNIPWIGLSQSTNGRFILDSYMSTQNELNTLSLLSEGGIDSIADFSGFGSEEGIFSLSLDRNFDFNWFKIVEGAQPGFASTMDGEGNFYQTGFITRWGNININPLGAPVVVSPGSSLLFYLAIYNPEGELLAYRTNLPFITDIEVNSRGEILISGYIVPQHNPEMAFPGHGLEKYGGNDAFYAVLDSVGETLLVDLFGGEGSDAAASITSGSGTHFMVSGHATSSIQFNSNNQQLGLDGVNYFQYVLNYNHVSCVPQEIIPSIEPVSCDQVGSIEVFPPDSLKEEIVVEWESPLMSDSNKVFVDNGGFYSFRLKDSTGCGKDFTFFVPGPLLNDDKGVKLGIFADEFRSGFNSTIFLTAYNEYCHLENGTLVLIADKTLNYLSSSIDPDSVMDNRLEWSQEDLRYQSVNNTISIQMKTPSITPFGDTLQFKAFWLYDEDSIRVSTDTLSARFEVVNAYDPNDKQVNPQGFGSSGRIANNLEMVYKVRFQNTGNADAINVYISDFLPPELNPNTLRIIDHSHPMAVELKEDRHLRFLFEDIFLPDSSSNSEESIGYVIFALQQISDLPEGTIIENEAQIFFDFNEPIITDHATNVIDLCEHFQLNISESGEELMADLPENSSVQWINCDSGTLLEGERSSQLTPDSSGTYGFVATDGYCIDTSDCILVLLSSLEEFSEDELPELWPNPVNDELTIGGQFLADQIEVFDSGGRLMYSEGFSLLNLADHPKKLNVRTWNNGIYIVRIKGKKGAQKELLFMKVAP